MTEMFRTLIMVVTMQEYLFVKSHQTTLKVGVFYCTQILPCF